ncbi:hypothetical protein [Bradyrhizobium sp. USDA 4473]
MRSQGFDCRQELDQRPDRGPNLTAAATRTRHRIFSQRNDRLSIASLAGIYEKEWMPPRARECFEDARKQLNDHLDSPATVTFPDGYADVSFMDICESR